MTVANLCREAVCYELSDQEALTLYQVKAYLIYLLNLQFLNLVVDITQRRLKIIVCYNTHGSQANHYWESWYLLIAGRQSTELNLNQLNVLISTVPIIIRRDVTYSIESNVKPI